jgi:hypothetical protein
VESRRISHLRKKYDSCFAEYVGLPYKEETKGGESMKIKMNVRAGGGKARS